MDIPKLLTGGIKVATGIPSWAYATAGITAALGAGALWVSHQAASHQAAKDAPAIQQGVVQGSAAGLADRQLSNSNTRASHEASIDTRTAGHVTAVSSAADDRAAFDAYLRGLHDGLPLPSPAGNHSGDVGSVQGGPRPEGPSR